MSVTSTIETEARSTRVYRGSFSLDEIVNLIGSSEAREWLSALEGKAPLWTDLLELLIDIFGGEGSDEVGEVLCDRIEAVLPPGLSFNEALKKYEELKGEARLFSEMAAHYEGLSFEETFELSFEEVRDKAHEVASSKDRITEEMQEAAIRLHERVNEGDARLDQAVLEAKRLDETREREYEARVNLAVQGEKL